MEYDWASGLGRLFELPPQTTPVSLKPIIPGALYAWVVKDFPTPPIAAGLSVDRAKLRFSKELREEMRLEGLATHLGASASYTGYLGFMVWSVKSKCRLLKFRLLHG